MKTQMINKRQAEFLKNNTHLKPVYYLGNGAWVVRDTIVDDFKNPIHYVLTPDCKVQNIHAYFSSKVQQ